jgi:hypothetical protein
MPSSLAQEELQRVRRRLDGGRDPSDDLGARHGRLDDLDRALVELARVLTPGGRLLATLPYGRPEDHGWFRQFGREDVARIGAARDWRSTATTVYRYSADGWQLSDLEQAAGERYWDHHQDPAVPGDRAAAARAVVCLLLEI